GGKHAFIISDPQLTKMGLVKDCEDILQAAGIAVDAFTETEGNPSVETVEKATEQFKASGADIIVALGGGSPMDVAKAVGKGILRVIKDMGLKDPYVGQTALETGEIAEDLTYYFAASEQVPSSVGLGVLLDKETNTVKQAGGFILQLMPFADEETISKLESNLRNVDSVTKLFEEGKTPEQILELLLEGLEPEFLQEGPVEFWCNCDKTRVEKALISLGKKELEEMIAEGKEIELNCHFCSARYVFLVEELKALLKRAKG
ncbi:MAG: Hsp33 family molecular chaperone HslO, partial [Lachnospiraceae bacterium]